MRVRWIDLAVEDLVGIADRIAADNPEAAQRMASRLWHAAQQLAVQPEMGRPGRVPGTRELVVPDTPFILPYRIAKGEVQILRAFHGARRWPQSL